MNCAGADIGAATSRVLILSYAAPCAPKRLGQTGAFKTTSSQVVFGVFPLLAGHCDLQEVVADGDAARRHRRPSLCEGLDSQPAALLRRGSAG